MRNPFSKPAPIYGGYANYPPAADAPGGPGAPPAYGSTAAANPYSSADAHHGAPPPTYHGYYQPHGYRHGEHGAQQHGYRPGPGQHMGYFDPVNRGSTRWGSVLVTLRRISALLSIAVVFVNVHLYRVYRYYEDNGFSGNGYVIFLYLSLPVALFDIIWQFVEVCAGIRARRRGNPMAPWGLRNRIVIMVMETILFLGSAVCFALLCIATGQRADEYYPFRDAIIITVLMGMITVISGVVLARLSIEALRSRRAARNAEPATVA